MAVRKASHAGSWYTDSAKELDRQLSNWLNCAELTHGPARAIISPHAGYQYCGACAAHGFRQISPAVVRKIFILGPSHHVRLAGCALSSAVAYATPFYDLKIDQDVYSALQETGEFQSMSLSVDEAEHSMEMQLPYIAKVMADFKDAFTIVPIMVGSLTPEEESDYGAILAPYLQDPSNLFVISSDFCHWGQRFRYTFYDRSWGEIHQSIECLDKKGMEIIERLDPKGFTQYLKQYGNTICGRHPIGVLLQAIDHVKLNTNNGEKMNLRFLKYAQSSQCINQSDSSVSYATGALLFE